MTITIAVLSLFLCALFAPWIYRVLRHLTGWVLALLPLAIFGLLLSRIPVFAAGEVIDESLSWVPSLGVNLSFHVDGLSLLFALLITGIGALVLIYAGGYLAGHPLLGRFYAYILLFMGSMLGVVTAGNIILLFIFWELTSFSSYLLIGFDHQREESRASALQALLVTGIGGLALLVGLLIIGGAAGSLEMSELLRTDPQVFTNALYLPALLLILAGAFTKSAQVPFHFWLPNAMEAPTPVSAYLHSATMVKAGVYLLARMSPVLGGTDAWLYLVAGGGAATMLVGAYLALQQYDLKRILAYSTVSSLGALVMLLGLGTVLAVEAAMVYLLGHALYKGAMFLIAGAVDHETGTRDIRQLGGLARAMPYTATAVCVAALSMAGLPPLLGFLSKELLYEAALYLPAGASIFTPLALVSNILMVAVAGIVALGPFFGQKAETPKKAHEPPLSMLVGPLLLGGLGLSIGLLPALISGALVSPAVSSVLGQWKTVKLALWHGLNPMLALSAATLAGGAVVYTIRAPLRRAAGRLDRSALWGPARWYEGALVLLNQVAKVQTAVLQSGYLRYYILMIMAVTVGLGGLALATRLNLIWPAHLPDIRLFEALVILIILMAVLMAVRSFSRLAAVAALGVVGFGVSTLYIFFGAPDLAMTQIMIETLAVILLVLVLYKLPQFVRYSNRLQRVRDAFAALTVGGLMTILIILGTAGTFESYLTPYFLENSLTMAKGHNIVNVILVDFRALDTMGEVTVLLIAAIGVFSLLKLRMKS